MFNLFKRFFTSFIEPKATTYLFEDLYLNNITNKQKDARTKFKANKKELYSYKTSKEKSKLKRHRLSDVEVEKWNDDLIREFVGELWIRQIPDNQLTKMCRQKFQHDINNYHMKQCSITYLRHNCTNYDTLRKSAERELSREDARIIHDCLKTEVYNLISKFYPNLDVAVKQMSKVDNMDLSLYLA